MAIGDVVGDAVIEQKSVLIDHGDEGAQISLSHLPQIDAVNRQSTPLGIVEATKEIDDRALATPTWTHQGHGCTTGHLEIQAGYHLILPIGEAHLLGLQALLETLEGLGPQRIARLNLYIEDGEQLLRRR